MCSTTRLLRAACVFSAAALAACGGNKTTTPEDPVATSVELSTTSVSLTYITEVRQITATVRDQNGQAMQQATVAWVSNDESVVTVTSSGVVTAVANGSTTVTATFGGLSASATVEVAQVARFLLPVSGDDQEAIAGNALADPIVVRAVDQGGRAVEGASVSFAPDSDGSVSVASATSDASGEAQTTWTLGSQFGPQTLTISIQASSIEFSAFSRSPVPIPDLVVTSSLGLLRADPTTLETFRAIATIRNDGDLDTGTTFRVAVLSDGLEVASTTAGPLAVAAEEQVDITVGPLTAGTKALSLVVDVDDDIAELIESNNDVGRSMLVRQQESVTPGVPRSNLSANTNEELLFRIDIPQSSPPTMTVTLVGGGAGMDADLFIEGPARPSLRDGYDGCISASPTSTETCQIVDASGTYHILVHAFTAFSGVTLEVTLGNQVVPYDIEVVFIDNGTATQDQAVLDAAAFWESAIIGDLPDVDFSSNPSDPDQCISGQPVINDVIDDIRIYVVIEFIDGPLGTLASAGPCFIRSLSALPIAGSMRFDSADLERLEGDGDMYEVILHEMAHVLGFGTIWRPRELLQNPSLGDDLSDPSDDNPGADTYFTGPRARDAFDAAGGMGYMGAKVPVENGSRLGSSDAHWRESVFDTENMSPSLDPMQVNPVSAITIEQFADMSYGVDVSVAESYSLPSPSPAQVAGARAGMIDLSNDIRRGPITVVDRNGRVVRILR